MKTFKKFAALSFAAGLWVTIGCAHNDEGPPNAASGTAVPQGVTNAQNVADERIVDELTNARCDHEQSCDNVGSGKKYVSRSVCAQEVRDSVANDLNAYQCPRGIDESGLNHCLASLRADKCGLSFESLTRLNDCRSGALCMK